MAANQVGEQNVKPSDPENLAAEEVMMKKKYPSAKAGRSALLEKRLSRGGPKYFDSGDYNMARAAIDPLSKHKLNLHFPLAMNGPSSPSNTPPSPDDQASPLGQVPSADVAGGAMNADISYPQKNSPPTAISMQHRRLSRQQSKLVDDFEPTATPS